MSHYWRGVLAGLLGTALVTMSTVLPAQAADVTAEVPDAALRTCLLRELEAAGLPPTLTSEGLAELDSIDCDRPNDRLIADLSGVEYLERTRDLRVRLTDSPTISALAALPALTSLSVLAYGQLDLSLLARLPHLDSLRLYARRISDIGFLRELPQLTSLGLKVANGVDGSPLTALDNLVTLDLSTQRLAEFAPVCQLPSLRTLNLASTGLTEVSALRDCDGLSSLDLSSNDLTDVSALSGLRDLASLTLDWNSVTSLTPLAGLPELTSLSVAGNPLATLGSPGSFNRLHSLDARSCGLGSVEALRGAVRLAELDLSNNSIGDISPLAGLPDGARLNLTNNRIHDFSALRTWSGTLDARWQRLTLPGAVARVPFPVALLDERGRPLKIPKDMGPSYADGAVTFTYSAPSLGAKSFEYTFYNGDSWSTANISGTIDQPVADGPFTKTTTPELQGLPQVGMPLWIVLRDWVPLASDVAYQWYRDGAPIARATSETYVLAAADAGHRISARIVAGCHEGCTRVTRGTASSAPVEPAYLQHTGTPVLSHAGKLVRTDTILTAVKPGGFDTGATVRYQWQRNGRNIAGATRNKYTVRAADVEHFLRVRVTVIKPGYYTATDYSLATWPEKARFANKAPVIGGTRQVGKKLIAKTTWPSGTKLTYQWYRNGKAIKGATKSSYTLKTGDRGDRFKVKVTAKKSGYVTLTKTSATTAKVKAKPHR